MSAGGHSFHKNDWLKVGGGAALAATGLGAAGIGPLAGMFGSAGAGGLFGAVPTTLEGLSGGVGGIGTGNAAGVGMAGLGGASASPGLLGAGSVAGDAYMPAALAASATPTAASSGLSSVMQSMGMLPGGLDVPPGAVTTDYGMKDAMRLGMTNLLGGNPDNPMQGVNAMSKLKSGITGMQAGAKVANAMGANQQHPQMMQRPQPVTQQTAVQSGPYQLPDWLKKELYG